MSAMPKILGLALAIAAMAQVPSEIEKDKKLLQGNWEVVSMLQAGREIPRDGGKLIFAFQGDKITVKLKDKILNEGTYKIDPGKKPKTIDVKDSRKGADLGIYEVNEKEIKLCMGGRGKDRPKEFTAPPENDQSLVILKRVN